MLGSVTVFDTDSMHVGVATKRISIIDDPDSDPVVEDTMDDRSKETDTSYIEAGQSAVRLMKEMAAMIPLRSDSRKIRERILLIEQVFDGRKQKR
jgi:hypothetical protein